MNKENKHIEDLLERFFNGTTTNAEEQELYTYFKSEDIPESLTPYKPVFGYFESGILQEAEKVPIVENTPPKRKKTKLIKYGIVSLIAASILAIFVFKPFTQATEPDIYEGSYIIENGVKSYDKERIHSEYQSIQLKMEQKEKEIEYLMESSEYKFNRYNIHYN